jgi:hypothetical protein
MNHTEATDILNELKIMFPDWTTWARSLPDVNATARVWTKALMGQDNHHVMDVIDEYINGKRKAPTSYEYERLIFNLVGAAREMRSLESTKEVQRETLQTWRDEQEQVKKRRGGYKSIQDRSMKIAAAQHAANADAVIARTGRPKSQWTIEDRVMYDEMAERVVETFKKRESLA